jgi:hypothetical protein
MINFKQLKSIIKESNNTKDGEGTVKDIDKWTEEPDTQYGSNRGGVHYDENGDKHYVKFYHNPQQARTEVAAARVHEMLGVNTNKPFLVRKNGEVGVASKWNYDLERKSPSHFDTLDHEQAKHIARIHHAGVLTKNWDAVGLEHDNITFHKKTGEPYSVDQGGTMNFRAQGGPKDYGDDVSEVHSFRNPDNYQAHHVFDGNFSRHPDVERSELDKVKALKYDDVHRAFTDAGLHDAHKKAKTLWNRRSNLLKHYGEGEE